MRAVIQRVNRCSVSSEGVPSGDIGPGLCVLLGVGEGDEPGDARWLAQKIAGLRIFEDPQGKMNLSVTEIGGSLMVVSQFTLYGDCRKGRRPSFVKAARPELGDALYQRFVQELRDLGLTVATGVFQTHMVVSIENDGPVTLIIDSPDREPAPKS